jgi:hypothetical protein
MESELSGLFFVKGSGIGTAVGVSLTNVALSFLLGLGPLRWRNRRRSFVSRSGFVITIAGFASIAVLHLCVALAPFGEDKAFATAWEVIQKAPWALWDVPSFWIMVVGLIFALGAAWIGYSVDDPYPRYGAAYRHAKSTREKYTNAYFDLFNELSEAKNDTIRQLNDGITTLPQFRRMAVDVRAQRAAMLNSFRAYETSVETATNQLLKLYRDINHAQRATAPPSYFDEKWQLPQSFLMSPELKTLLADPEAGDVVASLSELERLSKAITTRYELLHERFPHPSEMD